MKIEPTHYETRYPTDSMPRVPRHGTYGEYTNHRCRCASCRAANTRYNLKRRAERQQRLRSSQIEVEHGKYSTYTNYGCRCEPCKRANSERVINGGVVDGVIVVDHDK